MSDLKLIGYGHSVYSRSVRIALEELALPYLWEEADPFDEGVKFHPFNRVPVLFDGNIRIYECWAILEYLYRVCDRYPERNPLANARAAQLAGIASAYAYWPLVRCVYSHGVFRPALNLDWDQSKIDTGLAEASVVLKALEEIAADGVVLAAGCAPEDCILFPMIDAFGRYPAAAEMLAGYPNLNSWWGRTKRQKTIAATYLPLTPES
ncbi:hypothetical protein RA27_01315 [Ruegeria sp. ANG-R]|uniref:glutathione S-transferase family protein n=1 Tax=Ruegeria sp. ANG-R TaxID=1577903 RepID=UPI00057F6562|nr:glutathione S-transferase family protein [Ruegeria sp. ANG-R]KIC42073.1 hypothetical protein RA27_01315 [Ruegeria sp. ANG-R]